MLRDDFLNWFCCPVCGGALIKNEKNAVCDNGHSFDFAKKGYINLLMSQQSSDKRHGDDKLMVRSRRGFLDGGFYKPLAETVAEMLKAELKPGLPVCDIGCGEGYYTQYLKTAVPSSPVFGIDISKNALIYAAKRCPGLDFAVASAFSLPFCSLFAGALVNIFAPCAYPEFARVLKDDGVLIKAVPLSEHLFELKAALYDKPYKNKPELCDDVLFEKVSEKELKYTFKLSSQQQIYELFTMTPYFYKTSRKDAEKLLSLESLEATAHFAVEVYKKRIGE